MQDQQDAIIRKMLRESAEACFGNEWTPSGKRFGFGKRPLHQALLTRWRGRRGLVAPDQPWSIFTAGCMGVGKTHVMQALYLPISPHISPYLPASPYAR